MKSTQHHSSYTSGYRSATVRPTTAAYPRSARRRKYLWFVRLYALVWKLVWPLLIFLLGSVLFNLAFLSIHIGGDSMAPEFTDGELAVVNRLAYQYGEIQRGDIIVSMRPPFEGQPAQEVTKRIIGLPGETVSILEGELYINDVLLAEPYIWEAMTSSGSWTVPSDAVFVMGDNRNLSIDSRDWGPLPMDQIIGEVVFVYWPLKDIRFVVGWDYFN